MRIGTYQLNQSDRRDGLVFASYSEGTRDVTQEGEVECRSTVVACYLWFMFGHVGGVETKLLFYVQRSTYRYCYSVSRLITISISGGAEDGLRADRRGDQYQSTCIEAIPVSMIHM